MSLIRKISGGGSSLPTFTPPVSPFVDDASRDVWAAANLNLLYNGDSAYSFTLLESNSVAQRWGGANNPASYNNSYWITVGAAGIEEAPVDGSIYSRKNSSWVTDSNLTGGYLVYSDLATDTTPIVHNGGVDTVLTNDELGPQTQKTFAPTGITDVWNAVGTTFDFSELANGDMLDIRLNVTVTTSSANQEIFINLELGQGGFSYPVPFSHDTYKSTGVVPIGSYEGIFIGDDNTRLNGGQFIFSSDQDATIVVHGWYCRIIRVG